jgi:hypothetical protein
MSSQQDPDEKHKKILIHHLRNPRKGGVVKISYLNVSCIPHFPKGGIIHLELTALRNITNLPTLPLYLQTLTLTQLSSLTSLPDLPDTVSKLTIIDTPLERLPKLPEWLQVMTLLGTNLTTLEALPPHLIYLSCAHNRHLSCIKCFSPTLVKLNCNSCPLENLPPLPDSLEALYCEKTHIKILPTLSNSLLVLDARESMIEQLPPLPKCLIFLDVEYTSLRKLPPIPSSLVRLMCKHTHITQFPHMLSERLLTLYCDIALFNQLYEVPAHLELLEVYDSQENQIVIRKTYTDHTDCIMRMNLEKFKQRCTERCFKIMEELIAEVWKPSRVAAFVEAGRWDMIDIV